MKKILSLLVCILVMDIAFADFEEQGLPMKEKVKVAYQNAKLKVVELVHKVKLIKDSTYSSMVHQIVEYRRQLLEQCKATYGDENLGQCVSDAVRSIDKIKNIDLKNETSTLITQMKDRSKELVDRANEIKQQQ